MHQYKSIMLFVLAVITIIIFAIREGHDSSYQHGFYHTKIEILEVLDCYNGSIVICNLRIQDGSSVKEIEYRDALLKPGSRMYRLCFHRGSQRDARCYTELSPTLPAKYRATRSEVVFDE